MCRRRRFFSSKTRPGFAIWPRGGGQGALLLRQGPGTLPLEDRRSMIAAELMGRCIGGFLLELEARRFDVLAPALTRLSKTQKIFLILRTWLRLAGGSGSQIMASHDGQRRLIANADDFGRSASINQSRRASPQGGHPDHCQSHGQRTRRREAVELARQNPGLGWDCTLTLVCGEPRCAEADSRPGWRRRTF